MNARTTALSALIAMRRQNAWADGALKDYTARDRLDRRDAALAARLLYGVVQNRMLLDFYLAQAVASPLTKLQPVVLDILRLGAYQILFLDKIPVSAAVNEAVEQTKTYANKRAAGLVNGSLRTLARRKDELEKPHDLATKYSHPQPLVDCLRASMDEETLEAFLAADNDIPKTALQANPLKASAELPRWTKRGSPVSRTRGCPAASSSPARAISNRCRCSSPARSMCRTPPQSWPCLPPARRPACACSTAVRPPAARASPPPCRWKIRAASCPATCTRIRFP